MYGDYSIKLELKEKVVFTKMLHNDQIHYSQGSTIYIKLGSQP